MDDVTTYDSTYANRYTARNAKKIKAILAHMPQVESILDIGTNQGYMIRSMLETGKTREAFGLELQEDVVDPELKRRDDFTLHVGDIVDFDFPRNYDVIIYNAVHHHVIGKYGLQESWRLWKDVIDHCGEALFFETGLIAEKGEYYWKDALQTHYSSDHDYLNSLFRAIGPRLKKVTHVTKLSIHGINRIIYKFELHPIGSSHDLGKSPAGIYGEFYKEHLPDWSILETLRRTAQSASQNLVPLDDQGYEHMFGGTDFYYLKDSNEKKWFAKKSYDPFKMMREFMLLNAVNHKHVIKPALVSEEYGLVFEFLPWEILGNTDISEIENRSEFIDEIKQFFTWATESQIAIGELDIDPNEKEGNRRLIDLVDMHANNFMVLIESNRIQNWCLIDLEYFSNNNFARNMTHLGKITGEASTSSSFLSRLASFFK